MNLQKNTERSRNRGNELFPVFLKLANLHTVLVGGGTVGLEKLTALLRNAPDARVTVVSTKVSEALAEFAARYPAVHIFERPFKATDLDDADLVVVATNLAAVNEQVRSESRSRGLLVNVADKPELCDFYLGSVVQKGELKIGISTNGKSPTAARRLKEILQEALPEELDEVLKNLNAIRNTLSGDFSAKVHKLNEITRILIDAEKEDQPDPLLIGGSKNV
ncbi:MAG TPA: bifunctional precorrin-2 dehydrogenase/sirohydrochlorin ferrochelatase [Sphingobacteriaceae bacterium]